MSILYVLFSGASGSGLLHTREWEDCEGECEQNTVVKLLCGWE